MYHLIFFYFITIFFISYSLLLNWRFIFLFFYFFILVIDNFLL